MTELWASAVLCGLGLGLGLWSLVSVLPTFRRVTVMTRVAPALIDVSEGAREFVARRTVEPIPVLGTLFLPRAGYLRRLLGELLGGDDRSARRLRQAGESRSVASLRNRQLAVATLALLAGGIFSVILLQLEPGANLPAIALLPPVLAVAAIWASDWWLGYRAKKRCERITSEFPTVLEFLSLSLAAGESMHDAIRRVATIGTGELSHEFHIVIRDVATGVSLAGALRAMTDALRIPALSRTIDHMLQAMERGTPMADVLRAQANDARAQAKRRLMEDAGKKEVGMLVPLVFLILPLTILFALAPGLLVLRNGL